MQDFLTDNTGDLQIIDGDFATGLSDQQHQQYLLLAEKGAFKQYPATGVGLIDFLNDDSPADMLREVRLQFSQDGMKVNGLTMVGGKLQVDASY